MVRIEDMSTHNNLTIRGKGAQVMSRPEIIRRISNGQVIVIYKNWVLDLTKWLPMHPGGDKAVQHMIGRDATDEMHAYHSDETVLTFKRWKIGEIDYFWENLLPPIQGGVYTSSGEIEKTSLDFSGSSGSSSSSDIELESSSTSLNTVDEDYEDEVLRKHTNAKKSEEYSTGINRSLDARSEVIIDPQSLMEQFDGQLVTDDVKTLPSLAYNSQQHLRDEFVMLHKTITDNGFFQCNYWDYFRELIKISTLFIYAFSCLKLGHYILSATFIGMAWQQMVFVVHDAGHLSITHNYFFDNLLGMSIASWIGGLSCGWWKRNHNVHHIVTNDPVHDPDIQHLPFFAVSVKLFNNVYSTYYEKTLSMDAIAKKLIPIQKFMYYPLLCFGKFNLYRLAWMHLINGDGPRKGKAWWFRYYELAGLVFFFYWYFYLLVCKSIEGGWNKFNFVMVSHVAVMLVHVQITLSHFAMSTSDLGTSESFPQRQIRTTMDVACPEWLDFLHGGLQFQAIHHLFPRLPRHNLRRVQPFVIDFCKRVGLSYSIYGFKKGNEIVIGKLADIGEQCSILLEATKELHKHTH